MSRIGARAIKVEQGVQVSLDGNQISIKSERGQINFNIPKKISVNIDNNRILLTRVDNSKDSKALHGMSARIITNMIFDTKNGAIKKLEFKGTGYRAKVEDGKVILNMGYSHQVELPIPEEINVSIVKNIISVEGIDRARVGQFAAQIREIRPPEVYKGKGIKYQNESIKKKAGKAAQAAIAKA